MISLARRVLRLHRGYASAPDRVLRAIVRFLDPRGAARRAARRRARVPRLSRWSSTRRRRHDRSGANGPVRATWSGSSGSSPCTRQLNEAHFDRALGTVPIRLSGRMRHSARRAGRRPPHRTAARDRHQPPTPARATRGPRWSTRCCTRWCTSGRPRPAWRWTTGGRSGRRRGRWASSRRPAGASRGGTPRGRRGLGVLPPPTRGTRRAAICSGSREEATCGGRRVDAAVIWRIAAAAAGGSAAAGCGSAWAAPPCCWS